MFNKICWIEYFFSKKYTIGMMEEEIAKIVAVAESTGIPELYLAHLAFQLQCNGCTRKATEIIEAAKQINQDVPFENIPDYVIEDENAFQAGQKEDDIVQERIESMYLTFMGKPMNDNTKIIFRRSKEGNEPAKNRTNEGFGLHDFVIQKDEGLIAGEITSICTTTATGISRLQFVMVSGEYGFGLAQEFRLMTETEIDSFQKRRIYIEGIE